ncbi:hypothetical protein [Rhodopirellula baltica]|nr:hypothetical protein [Rhodopirellula baltica]
MVIMLAFAPTARCLSQDASSVALLHRALDVRMETTAIDIRFSHNDFSPEYDPTECRIEMRDGLFRCEGRRQPGNELLAITLIAEDYVWIYNPGSGSLDHKSKERYLKDGSFCFDPRLFGIELAYGSIRPLKGYFLEGIIESEVVGTETIDGMLCSKVRVRRSNAQLDYLIHEPTGRIFKASGSDPVKTPRFPSHTIRSTFVEGSMPKWLPSEVSVDHPQVKSKCSNIVAEQDPPDPSRFTLQGLDLPVGLPVVDYDGQRRIGYWNGEEIVEDFPLEYAGQIVERSPWTLGRMIGLTLVAIVVIGLFFRYRGSRN